MTESGADSMTVPAGAETKQPIVGAATCPLCHAADETMTDEAVAAGADWRCKRCGQMWTADRLKAAAAYDDYVGGLPH